MLEIISSRHENSGDVSEFSQTETQIQGETTMSHQEVTAKVKQLFAVKLESASSGEHSQQTSDEKVVAWCLKATCRDCCSEQQQRRLAKLHGIGSIAEKQKFESLLTYPEPFNASIYGHRFLYETRRGLFRDFGNNIWVKMVLRDFFHDADNLWSVRFFEGTSGISEIDAKTWRCLYCTYFNWVNEAASDIAIELDAAIGRNVYLEDGRLPPTIHKKIVETIKHLASILSISTRELRPSIHAGKTLRKFDAYMES